MLWVELAYEGNISEESRTRSAAIAAEHGGHFFGLYVELLFHVVALLEEAILAVVFTEEVSGFSGGAQGSHVFIGKVEELGVHAAGIVADAFDFSELAHFGKIAGDFCAAAIVFGEIAIQFGAGAGKIPCRFTEVFPELALAHHSARSWSSRSHRERGAGKKSENDRENFHKTPVKKAPLPLEGTALLKMNLKLLLRRKLRLRNRLHYGTPQRAGHAS
jgi:hypothetical protein